MLSFRQLYIFVEGNDDERFFSKILPFILKEKYNVIKIIKYAQMKKEKVCAFIKSIKAMKSFYIFVTDINNSPCITAKKEKTINEYRNLDSNNIIVVVKEIESWYLAGLDSKACDKLGIDDLRDTEHVTKEKFDSLIPDRFTSRIDFMLEILRNFSVEIAIQKNSSFRYFVHKYDPPV